ncbi:hypothetical protein [Paenisporosarcina indica]|uniref:hypothetical protein n=1 Tax=Paenisporosarcina indica TaxID=650093 RepID=UPI00094F68B9|nr:hypothetical protein [Paenisporosarcina indica]
MFKIMKYLIFIILIYAYDALLGFIIFDHIGSDGLMTIFVSTIIATALAIITTYYLIKLIDNLLGI